MVVQQDHAELLAALQPRQNFGNNFSRGLLERYGPPKKEPEMELGSTSLNDSEQMANELNVADWEIKTEDDWRPEGETGDDWKPIPVEPSRGRSKPSSSSLSSLDPGSGLFSKGQAALPKPDLVQVNFLTEGILAQHTKEQSFEARMQEWRHGAIARGEAIHSAAPAVIVPGGWTTKMAGLQGEDQAPEDDAERAAASRVLFRPVAGAAALPSGRQRNSGGIFQSARRAISIRRDLSMRSHGRRPIPQTVRVAAPVKTGAAIVPQTKAEKEEAAREAEKLAREAARRAARRAAARAAALNAAKQAEDDAARAAREAEQEQADADAQRVAQVARRAAVAREAAQAARRKRQPIFQIEEKAPRVRAGKGAGSTGTSATTTQPGSRPSSQRTNTQSPRTQRSVTAGESRYAISEKGSTRSSPGPSTRKKRPAIYSQGGQRAMSQSHRSSSSPDPSMRKPSGRQAPKSERVGGTRETGGISTATSAATSTATSAATSASTSSDFTSDIEPPQPQVGVASKGEAAAADRDAPAPSSSQPPPKEKSLEQPPKAVPPPKARGAADAAANATTNAANDVPKAHVAGVPPSSNAPHHQERDKVYLPAQRLNMGAVTGNATSGAPSEGVATGGKVSKGRKSAGGLGGGGVPSPVVAA